MNYNFDIKIDRSGTHAAKLEVLPAGSPDDILSLWVADMDFPCAEPIMEALRNRVEKRIFGYTVYDMPRTKDAIQLWFKKRFDWEVDKSTMFFCPGIVPAIAFLINALTEEGDGIIIQRPVYYPFTNKIEGNGRVVINNPLIREGNTYYMDFEDLDKKFADPKCKGMILCSPHNPVGRVWTEEELRKVVDIAKKYDKWIISDEIHADLTRVGVTNIPLLKLAPDYKDRIIACTAPSKTFNLAGMQFSNIIIPNVEYQKAWSDITDTKFSISMCNPFGLEATIAAYTDGDEWLDQLRAYIDTNIAYIEKFVKEELPDAEMIKCEGTYLVWLDVRKYCSDKNKLEKAMVENAKLALDEGYIFGEEGIGYERINVATPMSNIILCMDRMKTALLAL